MQIAADEAMKPFAMCPDLRDRSWGSDYHLMKYEELITSNTKYEEYQEYEGRERALQSSIHIFFRPQDFEPKM